MQLVYNKLSKGTNIGSQIQHLYNKISHNDHCHGVPCGVVYTVHNTILQIIMSKKSWLKP